MFYKITRILIVCLVTTFMSVSTFAEADLTKPPTLPEQLKDGETIEPEINIIHKDDRMIEEYRVNGQLYMIKVTPSVGPSYYLMDTDGDGSLETTSNELDSGLLVPNWVLLRW